MNRIHKADITMPYYQEKGYTEQEVWAAREKAIPEYLEETRSIPYNQKAYSKIFKKLVTKELEAAKS